MAIHDNFVDLGERLIKKNGRDVTILQTTITPSATEPWKTAGTPSTKTANVKAAFFNDKQSDFLAVLTQVAGRGDQEVTSLQGNNIQQVLISAKGLPFAPTIKDQIIDGDVTWEVTSVITEKPGPTVVMYTLEVKR